MEKIFTFEFQYDAELDGYGTIQFCAKNKSEAEKLWKCYCTETFGEEINPRKIEVVYNKLDHECYGDSYGTPEEYKANESAYN